ncbi:MAG TPA: hypothetical protein ENH10_06915 [Bacteroidetes bacterium]|nr:hypothetical protein BMS3Bbin04_01467 [bacterium BMS3Bbin04]HDO65747.1 hypothetical protein [Bacteroidota bacterium]HEX04872.1 hypothetical protein [Bacteroidota bacterium]
MFTAEIKLLILAIILMIAVACTLQSEVIKGAQAADGLPAQRGIVQDDRIDEASGMVASRRNPGWLWIHNDSGDPPRLFAVSTNGDSLGVVRLRGIRARDWEDIAIGPGPIEGRSYIYIGDIGDNAGVAGQVAVYRFLEPDSSDFPTNRPLIITDFDRLRFVYPKGPRDCETLMVDPQTGDIFILSKRKWPTEVYRAKAPHTGDAIRTLEEVAKINVVGISAGDISPDGRHLVIKSGWSILHWYRPEGTSIASLFESLPDTLPYVREPQGEALALDPLMTGYYTVSEEVQGSVAAISYYPFRPDFLKASAKP